MIPELNKTIWISIIYKWQGHAVTEPQVFAETHMSLGVMQTHNEPTGRKEPERPLKAFSAPLPAQFRCCFSFFRLLPIPILLFINTFRLLKANRRDLSSPRVVVYRRKPLITGYVDSTTSCSPLGVLLVISWPALIKRLRLFSQLHS